MSISRKRQYLCQQIRNLCEELDECNTLVKIDEHYVLYGTCILELLEPLEGRDLSTLEAACASLRNFS